MKALAPITLFVYDRPQHTLNTLQHLSENEEAENSILYIFCDGPKANATMEQLERIENVRKVIREKKWCGEIKIMESAINKGLANSIIAGVTEVVNKHSKVIVLEDDLSVAKYFLRFMNDALTYYERNDAVISIHGYVYPVHLEKWISQPTVLIKDPGSWGWATWKRGWDLFEPNGEKLLKEIEEKKLTKEFDFYSGYPFTRMLRQQIQGKISSWAIRWRAAAFLQGKYTLHPLHSLVRHDGNDTLATHHRTGYDYAYVELYENPVPVNDNVYQSKRDIERSFGRFLKKHGGLSIASKIRHRIIGFIRRKNKNV